MTEQTQTLHSSVSELDQAETGKVRSPISGILREPIVRPLSTGDGVHITYHWEAPGALHTFLYLSLRKDPNSAGMVAQTNVDSEDVRGQGDALWAFMGDTLQDLSNAGGVSILHEVHPNEYSRRLPLGDARYQTDDGGVTFTGTFSPQTEQLRVQELQYVPHEPVARTAA